MGKSNSIIVGSAAIRTWVKENMNLSKPVKDENDKVVSTASILGADGSGAKVRGRVGPFFVAQYLAANPGHVFGQGTEKTDGPNKPAERTVDLPLLSAKTGRAIKPVNVPVSEAKSLAGVAGKRGRLSSAELVTAAAAYQKG